MNAHHQTLASSRRLAAPITLAAVMLVGGCQSMDRPELVWQTLHAVDVAQTLNAASDPCYREVAPLTQAMIGSQPKDHEVILWGVGVSLAHAWIARRMETSNAPRWLKTTWRTVDFSTKTGTVLNNHRIGMRMFGDNRDVAGCTR